MSAAHPSTRVRPQVDPNMAGFARWSWRLFGSRAAVGTGTRLEEALLRAHWRITPEEYRASLWGATLLAAVVSAVAAAGLWLSVVRAWGEFPSLVLALFVVGAATGTTYLVVRDLPASRALARKQAIDRNLPGAVHFVAAMSCADVPVDEIFRELSAQPLYGEVANEAAWIVRDTDLLGRDILSALRAATRRSPSVPFQEFLQGVVTTAESGGDLRSYFVAQSERFERERAVRTRSQVERLGTYAEAYVTIAVAFPLFLLVLLAIFTLIEGTANGLLTLVWLTALGVIPAAEIAFGLLFRRLAREAM